MTSFIPPPCFEPEEASQGACQTGKCADSSAVWATGLPQRTKKRLVFKQWQGGAYFSGSVKILP
jgi:hypothetical protein